MSFSALAGRGIVVTRPREQAQPLAQAIEAAGGRPLVFPTIEITDPSDPRPALECIDRLESCDLAIFVSPNAVRRGLELVAQRRGKVFVWPARVKVAAVASGTRRALEERGFRAVIAPGRGHDSEALLAVPGLASVSGWRVVIFRGEGGRALLGDTLAQRGARVAYAPCYRRERPTPDPAPLLSDWARGAVHAVTASSSEGLDHLFALLGAQGDLALRATPLFVSHARIAEHARQLGVREVLIAGPGDAEMLERLMAYFRPSR